MITKVLLMDSGERIISGIAEMTDDQGNGIGFIIRCPYVLGMTPSGEVSPEGDPSQFQINFTKWFPFSSDIQFRIPYTSVVAIGEPEQNILNIYLEKFGDQLNDDDTLSTSNTSDSAEESGVSDIAD